jgi:hypothetical protein
MEAALTPGYFQIVRRAFERVYAELPEATRDAKIASALKTTSARYSNVFQLGGPDFSDEYVRAAYLFRYVAAHGGMVTKIIAWCPALRELYEQDKVVVTSLGGGPGTDVLALARYAIDTKSAARFYFNLVDREGAWAATWADVDMILSDHFHSSRTFFDVDVLVDANWKSKKIIFKANLISCSWFLSEISKHLDAALPFFSAMLEGAESGTKFLFVDFNHSHITKIIDDLASAYGLKVHFAHQWQFQVDPTEQKSELAEFIQRFDGGPKLGGQVMARLFEKP